MAFILAPESRSSSGENGLHMNGQDSLVQPLLTDLYQINMAYAYWKAETHDHHAVFDLFFRKNPFQGEFTVFAGLEDCLRFVENFKFSKSDIDYLKSALSPNIDPQFFVYLEGLDCKGMRIDAIPEGTIVFPTVPLITVEGPLAVCQLMETTFLNLVNYASLVATNAARFRLAAGEKTQMLEFGLRRAQGPNGGLTASKYCYIGGFDGTSNVLAGKLYGIPIKGTQAHSFISSFSNEQVLIHRELTTADGSKKIDLHEASLQKKDFIMNRIRFNVKPESVNLGELTAFVAYAIAFPDANLALLDTYDVLRSGLINFLAVTLALYDAGYKSMGCRIDSGDLAYLSKEIRKVFKAVASLDSSLAWVEKLTIVASNDINEETIMSLNEQIHEIDAYGVGTHLVTCQKQPALGCVFKLVELQGAPKIKISQEVSKVTIPCKKQIFRISGKSGYLIVDLMIQATDKAPVAGQQVSCKHAFDHAKRANVIPYKVERLQKPYWEKGEISQELPTLEAIKAHVQSSLQSLRADHCRYLNPTPYKVSVSEGLFAFLHKLWLDNSPVGTLE